MVKICDKEGNAKKWGSCGAGALAGAERAKIVASAIQKRGT
jgi:hypothetical protein